MMASTRQPLGKRLAPDTPFAMQFDRKNEAAVVKVSGSCTMDVSGQLGECLLDLASPPIRILVLDISELDFIESTGLGGIIAGYLRCRKHQGEVRLVAPQKPILALLQLTRLTQIFRVFDTVEEALSAPAPTQ